MCFGDFLPMRTICDAYQEEFQNLISVQSWTYLEALPKSMLVVDQEIVLLF